MGRAPCCDKANVKKGPWSPDEDAKLKAYIEQHGTGGNWIALPPKIGLKRCGKSCRLRWLNYLRPNIKRGGFSEEEESIICSLYLSIGSRWSIIAAQLPGRTDNDIKNYWNTRLKKKLLGKHRKERLPRQTSTLKQEMTKDKQDFNLCALADQIPYWPELPVSPVDSSLKDQSSVRNWPIKLAGRFSDTTVSPTNFQYPVDNFPTPDQLHESSANRLTGPDHLSQLTSLEYDVNSIGEMGLQELESFQANLGELIYGNETHLDDGLGAGYCRMTEVINCSSASSSAESTSWGDISSLIYPPLISDKQGYAQQSMIDSAFEESGYFSLQ